MGDDLVEALAVQLLARAILMVRGCATKTRMHVVCKNRAAHGQLCLAFTLTRCLVRGR